MEPENQPLWKGNSSCIHHQIFGVQPCLVFCGVDLAPPTKNPQTWVLHFENLYLFSMNYNAPPETNMCSTNALLSRWYSFSRLLGYVIVPCRVGEWPMAGPWTNTPEIIAFRGKLLPGEGLLGCFQKWWYPTTIDFPTNNDHFEVFWRYHHLRKHPLKKTCLGKNPKNCRMRQFVTATWPFLRLWPFWGWWKVTLLKVVGDLQLGHKKVTAWITWQDVF